MARPLQTVIDYINMNKLKLTLLFTAALTSIGFSATVDLSTWTVQNSSSGAGTWVVAPGNTSVLQTINGDPTVFLSPNSAIGTSIEGKIKVETTSDDDFVGFVLGFNPGDWTNAAADFLLIDWKKANQSPATVGLAVSRVNGLVHPDELWSHVNSAAASGTFTELARGSTLGSTGWVTDTEYTFGFDFTSTSLKVSVNGVEQINIAGSFSAGNLGFYNYSQSTVRYSGFTQDILPPPPAPGVPDSGSTIALLATSLAALGMVARRRSSARP